MRIITYLLLFISLSINTLNSQWINAGFDGEFVSRIFNFNNNLIIQQNNILYLSNNLGDSWDSLGRTTIFNFSEYCSIGDTLFGAINWRSEPGPPLPGLFRTFDYGKNWDTIHYAPYGVYNVVANNRILFCFDGYDWLKSIDYGTTWDTLSIGYLSPGKLYSFNNVLYYSTDKNGIYRSTNNGDEWSNISGNLEPGNYSLACSKYLYAFSNKKLFYSSIDNLNWNEIKVPVLDSTRIRIVLAGDQFLFLISENTVLALKNDTDTFIDISNGLPTSQESKAFAITSAVIINHKLILSSYLGIWRYDYSDLVDNNNKTSDSRNFNLEQNFPNPFNPTTKIKYSIPLTSPSLPLLSKERAVTLKVYDILGNEVATLVNEEKPAGDYEVEFDGSKLASGVYFYNIIYGEKHLTAKMNLIK